MAESRANAIKASTSAHPEVVVVGSVNLDLTLRVGSLPRRGETTRAGSIARGIGGKGCNQAVTAARLGRRTAFVGCIGEDDVGPLAREKLAAEGIDVSHLGTVSGPTGVAVVIVDADDSTVIVSAGANSALAPERVASAADMLRHAAAVLIQFETPLAAAVAAAKVTSGLVVVNPSPALTLPADLTNAVDVLVPNRHELAALVQAEPATDLHTVIDQARALADCRVVVTLGAEGAIVIDEADIFHVPAEKVDVVDTTAAGDSFCAALVDGLIGGLPLVEAAQWATAIAARVVSRHGAMDSIPSAATLRRLRQTLVVPPFERISRKHV